MPNPRTLLVLLSITLLLLVPTVGARPPKAITNLNAVAYPSAQEAMALAVDPGGRLAYVALRPDANAACGTQALGSTLVACKPDLAGYDISRGTATPAQGSTQTSAARPATAEALGAGIAVTPIGDEIAATSVYGALYVVKAGPGPVFAVFRAGQTGPATGAERHIPGDYNVYLAAITKDNTRLAVAGGDLTRGYVAVYGCCTSIGADRWNQTFNPTTSGGTARVNAMALAKDMPRLAVGTDEAIYWYTKIDSRPDADATWVVRVSSPVRALDVSDDGGVVVAGLASGEVYYFVTTSRSAFEAYASNKLAGAVTGVAVSGDGRSFAAVTGAKEFGLFEASVGPSGPVSVEKYTHTSEVAFTDVDASRDGSTFVAGGGSMVYGYTRVRSTPSWSLLLLDEAKGVAVSADGNRVFAASDTRFYAWQQTSEVTLDGLVRERNARPNELLPYAFTITNAGSLQDNYTISVFKPSASWTVDVAGTGADRASRLLAPDASSRVEFTLQPPAIERPARHLAYVEVYSQGLKKVVGREFFNITLARVVDLQLVSDQGSTLSLNQGEEVPFVFKIINKGNSYSRLNVTVSQQPSQPPTWTVTHPESEVNLSEGRDTSITATIVAPRDAADGTCNKITFAAVTNEGRGASLPIVACVNPEYQISLTADASNVQVAPRDTAVVKIRVENRGNTEDTVRLDTSTLPATAALDWRVSVDPAEVQLPRGGVRTATLSVRAAVANPPDVTITVRATSLGGTPQSVTVTAAAAPPSDNGSPAPAWIGAVLAVAFAAATARTAAGRRGR